MPIHVHIDRAAARVLVRGAVESHRELAAYGELFAHPDHRPGMPILIDERERDPAPSGHAIRELAHFLEERLDRLGPARIARVTHGDLAYGVARMFGLLLEPLPVEVRVFHSIEEAQAWLEEGNRVEQA